MGVQTKPESDRLQVTLSSEEAKAVRELSKHQDLSHAAVIRQALRLYQSTVFPLPDDGPHGCMGE